MRLRLRCKQSLAETRQHFNQVGKALYAAAWQTQSNLYD